MQSRDRDRTEASIHFLQIVLREAKLRANVLAETVIRWSESYPTLANCLSREVPMAATVKL